MRHIHNQSVSRLVEILLDLMQRSGYSDRMQGSYLGFAKLLSAYLEQNGYESYNESIGADFFDEFSGNHVRATNIKIRLFIERLNSINRGNGLLSHIKSAKLLELPPGLDSLLCLHRQKCIDKGLRPSSVQTHERQCREFLWLLADEGINDSHNFTTASISRACLRFSSKSCFSVIRVFLRNVFDERKTDKDYSVVVPRFRSPQPMPSVYSVDELRRIESAIDRSTLTGKRDFAIVLLATRLGIRPGNIATLTMDDLNFQSEILSFTQQKTGVSIILPMLPEIRDALLDYVQNARNAVAHKYVFISRHPPYAHLSTVAVGNCIRHAIRDANIDVGQRQRGPRAMRSSVASSMVNDNISYEVVRRTLGHTGKNAIKSYARLDIEQLKLYTLEPPVATGKFAEFLAGRLV